MTTTHTMKERPQNDSDLIASRMFADVFQAYMECSDEIQQAIREMVDIVHSVDATEDERDAAIVTIAEALFPSKHKGTLGMDLQECPQRANQEVKDVLKTMSREEATFSERLAALLEVKGVTQEELAKAIGVGQPAISMMLARNCRPQRRTVEKIAKALKVSPEEVWPGFKKD
jgi:lambda repressor-like predicted transcriptional regulator